MKKNLVTGFLLIFSVTVLFTLVSAKNQQHAWIGISTETVDEDLSEAFDLNVSYGAIVNEIIQDSPADIANLAEGDIIIAFNSEKVYDYDDLIDFLEDSSPDETVTLTIMREEDKLEIDVKLDQAPTNSNGQYGNNNWGGNFPNIADIPAIPDIPDINMLKNLQQFNYNYSYESSGYIGVLVTDISEQLRDYFGINDDRGVLVTEVSEDSPAEKAGIKAGDIIIEAANNDVADFNDLKESIADKAEGEIVNITLIREKKIKQIDVAVAEHTNKNKLFFKAPDISIQIPQGKRHTAFFSDDLNDFFNSDEFREEMEALKKDLQQMKFELQDEIHNQYNSKEIQNLVKRIKKEISENNSNINKELKMELEKLKKEMSELEKKLDD